MSTNLWAPNAERVGNVCDLILPSPAMLKPRDTGPVVLHIAPASLGMRMGEIDKVRTIDDVVALAEEQRRHFERYGVYQLRGGAAGAWTLTNEGRTKFLDGTFAVGTDTFKMALLASGSNIGAASTTYAAVTAELSTANGYTSGGVTVTLSLSGTTTVTLAFTQAQWSATGSGITARWVLCYESGGRVVAYALCDSAPADVVASSGNTFTVAAGNILTLA